MTEKLIHYEDPRDVAAQEQAEELARKQPFRKWDGPLGVVAARLELLKDRAMSTDPEPLVCPYQQCENTYVYENGKPIAKARGWVSDEDESGRARARRCQCLLDRIKKANPVKPQSRKLFDASATSDPEEDL